MQNFYFRILQYFRQHIITPSTEFRYDVQSNILEKRCEMFTFKIFFDSVRSSSPLQQFVDLK